MELTRANSSAIWLHSGITCKLSAYFHYRNTGEIFQGGGGNLPGGNLLVNI